MGDNEMKKRLAIVLVVSLLVGMLSGCKEDDYDIRNREEIAEEDKKTEDEIEEDLAFFDEINAETGGEVISGKAEMESVKTRKKISSGSDWIKSYLEYFNNHELTREYAVNLIYMDNDEIPEIVLKNDKEFDSRRLFLTTDGKDVSVYALSGYSDYNEHYIPGEGLIRFSKGNDIVYWDGVVSIENGQWKQIFDGHYGEKMQFEESSIEGGFLGEYSYGITDSENRFETLSGEEYYKRLNRVFPEKKAKQFNYFCTFAGGLIGELKVEYLIEYFEEVLYEGADLRDSIRIVDERGSANDPERPRHFNIYRKLADTPFNEGLFQFGDMVFQGNGHMSIQDVKDVIDSSVCDLRYEERFDGGQQKVVGLNVYDKSGHEPFTFRWIESNDEHNFGEIDTLYLVYASYNEPCDAYDDESVYYGPFQYNYPYIFTAEDAGNNKYHGKQLTAEALKDYLRGLSAKETSSGISVYGTKQYTGPLEYSGGRDVTYVYFSDYEYVDTITKGDKGFVFVLNYSFSWSYDGRKRIRRELYHEGFMSRADIEKMMEQ